MGSLIEVEQLSKRFGETTALHQVSFEVEQGTVLGILGPNGAGKTTAIRVLATLLAADSGRATVGGFDVATEPNRVRSLIALAGQYAAVDEKLSGAENLEMAGRLLGYAKAGAAARSAELLDQFGLGEAGDRLVGTYSGGMRRRADLAVSLVGRPRVLFLDEPTTGLDPSSRLGLWDIVRELVAEGTTVLLTTQYLEEADELADRIVVIDHGAVIAAGTGDELKDSVGGRSLEIELANESQLGTAAELLTRRSGREPRVGEDARRMSVPVGQDTDLAAGLIAELSGASIDITDFRLRRPTLDQAFLALTGGPTAGSTTEAEAAAP